MDRCVLTVVCSRHLLFHILITWKRVPAFASVEPFETVFKSFQTSHCKLYSIPPFDVVQCPVKFMLYVCSMFLDTIALLRKQLRRIKHYEVHTPLTDTVCPFAKVIPPKKGAKAFAFLSIFCSLLRVLSYEDMWDFFREILQRWQARSPVFDLTEQTSLHMLTTKALQFLRYTVFQHQISTMLGFYLLIFILIKYSSVFSWASGLDLHGVTSFSFVHAKKGLLKTLTVFKIWHVYRYHRYTILVSNA